MNRHTPIPKGFLKHPAHFIALGFGAGCVPKVPGTVGTLVGVLLYYPLSYLPWYVYLITTICCFLIGIYLCQITAKHLGVHDHGGIVWDEIVGFLVTMYAVPNDWHFMLLGFILFRILDICKPFPIRWVDIKVSGGLGIMLDDLLAGLCACLILQLMIYLL